MQHFSNFSSGDGAEKESGGGWARDAAIGGLEAGLGFAVTDKLHHAIANNPKLANGFLGSKVGKVAVGVGTGAVGTLAVGAGLNAVSGLLKKKETQSPADQAQAQYNATYHFANFAYDRATNEGFGATKNSFGTQSQVGKDAQWLRKNDKEGFEEYQRQGRVQADKLRNNTAAGLNQNTQNLPKQQVTKNINQQVIKNLNSQSPIAGVKGFLGKAKNTLGRYGKQAAGLGGLAMTGMYVIPQIASMLPQSKPQPDQESSY